MGFPGKEMVVAGVKLEQPEEFIGFAIRYPGFYNSLPEDDPSIQGQSGFQVAEQGKIKVGKLVWKGCKRGNRVEPEKKCGGFFRLWAPADNCNTIRMTISDAIRFI